MDYSTVHDWKPTHRPLDPTLMDLRAACEAAWRAVADAADRIILSDEDPPDVRAMIADAIKASEAIDAYLRFRAEAQEQEECTCNGLNNPNGCPVCRREHPERFMDEALLGDPHEGPEFLRMASSHTQYQSFGG